MREVRVMSGNETAISAIDRSMGEICELLRGVSFRSLAVVGRVSIPIILESGVFTEEEVKGILDEFRKFLSDIASKYSIGAISEGNGICWDILELYNIFDRIRDGVLEEVERLSEQALLPVPGFDYSRAMDERGRRVGRTMRAGGEGKEKDLRELSAKCVKGDIEYLQGNSPSAPRSGQAENKNEQLARLQEIVNDPISQSVSMENMEWAINSDNSGVDEPSDEELLLRMQEDSKGFAEMCLKFEESAMKNNEGK